MQVQSIIIANNIEFNRRCMTSEFTASEHMVWDAASRDLTDMALFWCGDNKLVVAPYGLQHEFVSDVSEYLKYRNTMVVSPASSSVSICEDIIHDEQIFGLLLDTLQQSPGANIICWGVTPQLYELLEQLRRAGVNPYVSETPSRTTYWTALYFESKAGSREFCRNLRRQMPSLRIPKGVVCGTKDLAVEAIAHFWEQQRPFVVKANYGTGGCSMVCYKAEALSRGIDWLRKDLRHRMSFDHFWENSPVILEEFIGVKTSNVCLAPTVDFLISLGGDITLMGTGAMLMRRDYMYSGIQCGRNALSQNIEETIIHIGHVVGAAMYELGYQGWFDVDFVVGDDDHVYVTEINARRASPAHVFEIAHRLRGPNWAKTCGVYANDHLRLQGSCHPSYQTLRDVFAQFNTEVQSSGAIAIPTIVSSSLSRRTPYLGYVILAESAPCALQFGVQLERQIRSSIGMAVCNEHS